MGYKNYINFIRERFSAETEWMSASSMPVCYVPKTRHVLSSSSFPYSFPPQRKTMKYSYKIYGCVINVQSLQEEIADTYERKALTCRSFINESGIRPPDVQRQLQSSELYLYGLIRLHVLRHFGGQVYRVGIRTGDLTGRRLVTFQDRCLGLT